jgi:hypothetical protein
MNLRRLCSLSIIVSINCSYLKRPFPSAGSRLARCRRFLEIRPGIGALGQELQFGPGIPFARDHHSADGSVMAEPEPFKSNW